MHSGPCYCSHMYTRDIRVNWPRAAGYSDYLMRLASMRASSCTHIHVPTVVLSLRSPVFSLGQLKRSYAASTLSLGGCACAHENVRAQYRLGFVAQSGEKRDIFRLLGRRPAGSSTPHSKCQYGRGSRYMSSMEMWPSRPRGYAKMLNYSGLREAQRRDVTAAPLLTL